MNVSVGGVELQAQLQEQDKNIVCNTVTTTTSSTTEPLLEMLCVKPRTSILVCTGYAR
jgi:hypothetical protein